MADREMKDAASTQSSSDSSSSDAEEGDSNQVETLVAGRQKRTTAANRYDRERLIEEVEEAAADEEDEVNLLFADDENEEDEEFEGSADEEDEDAHLDSSSDDEDQGPNAPADDLEGERDIQKQDKAERAKKRKADLALTTAAGIRKRVKIDLTLPQKPSTASKISNRKERMWAPIDASSSSRTSLRKQTVAHRAITNAKLKEDEKQRAKFKARKEKRDRERRRDAPRKMTQEDRLAEAEKTERRNAKSLNRWETMEKKRVEEQAAKLAALKNRKLEGPVVTWWSGVAKWTGPRLNRVGSKDSTQETVPEVKKRGRKPKAYHERMAAARDNEVEQSLMRNTGDQTATPAPSESAPNPPDESSRPSTPMEAPAPQITFATPQGPDNFLLEGIHEYASMVSDAPLLMSSEPSGPVDVLPGETLGESSVIDPASSVVGPQPIEPPGQQTSTPGIAQAPLPVENATRNLVVLENFDQLALANRVDYSLFYNSRKTAKLAKQNHELCPITALPARYRDPSTGIVYANSYAFRKIQELKRQEHTWSGMLGCYVGRAGFVARGVPEGFLGP